nr:MAG TPA: PolyVal ADP-Ribosyltransferase [Caudoviricetes sp.]
MGSIDRIRSLAKKYRGEDDEEEEIKISERKEKDNREEILKKAKKDVSVSSSVKKNNSDLKQPSYRNNKKVNMEIQDTPIITPTEATTISQSEIKANNEAEEMNKDIEEGGYKKANAIISNTLTSFAGGVKTGASGIANAVMLPTASLLQKINKLAQIKNEEKDDTWLKKASDNILNKAEEISNTANYDNFRNSRIQNNVARTAGTVSSVVGNMVPSIASNLVAPGSGLAVMGVSAGGNSAQEALNDRRDNLDRAITTGVLKGAVEVATEKLTGGNFLSKGSLDDLATKSISKISSKPLQKILSKGYEYGGEVLEEQISDIAGYIIDKVVNNQELPDLKTFWDNANETTKTTLLSTAVLNLFGLGGSTYKEVQEYSNNKDIERYLPEIESIVNKESDNIASNLEIKLNDKIQENQINKILNNKDLPMQSFQYETSKNTKINNLREDANKYFNNSKEAHSYVNMLENIITDKNIDIRLDGNLMTPDGRMANGSYSNGVITINPNSSKTGEFIAIHELTHAIGTDQMKNIINNYRKSNVDFDNSVKQLLNNYNSTEISEEALSDVSAQLFGTQEFIDNIAQNNPNIFQKIYSEIKYLWHQFKGYKNQDQFVNDLYYKWTQAYNSSNNLNTTTNYYIETVADFNEIEYNNAKEIKLPKQEYAILSTIINSDSNIKPGINKIETTNAQYEIYFKETGEFKVLDKIANEGEDINVFRRTLSRNEEARSKRFNEQLDSEEVSNKRTGTYNDGISENNSKGTYKRNRSNYDGKANSRNDINTKYSMQESENNSGSFSMQDNKGRELSEKQYEYFKNSKVRDNSGNLKEVYHGSNTDGITIFDLDKTSEDNVFGKGFYFTDNELMAESYAEDSVDTNGGSKRIYKEYLDIKNPFVIEGESTVNLANKIKEMDASADIIDTDYGVASTKKMTQWLKDNGYDGIEVKLNKDDTSYYIVFNSNQIKNIDNINPTTNLDIRYSKNNQTWQDYLETNYKTTGTRTNLEDIRIAPKAKKDIFDTDKLPTVQQKSSAIQSLPVGEYTGKQRKHYKSIIESQETTPQAKKIARELLRSDSYVPETNKGQLEQADARIMSSTPDSELKSLSARSINGEKITSVDIAVGERLIQYYSKTGDAVKLQEAIQSTAMAGTTAGQTVQALSLLNHQTPQGQAMWLQKSVDRMNNELAQRRGGRIQKDDNGNISVINKKGIDITEKMELFNFTPEMTQKIVSSKNDVELHNNLNEVYEQLGQQVTKTTLQKIDSWRYFAMLANPRTHIRNIVGNTAMATMQYGIKNKVAGAIEGVVSKFNPEIERTHTIVPASSEVKQFAKNDINNVLDRLGLTENKYNPKSRLENSMRTFKSDTMENTVGKLFDFNDRALEAEDGWGLKAGYKKALADYMTANKLTPENITDKQLAKARNYAVEQAKEATFHQENQLATLINQLSNKNKFAKYTTDAILPFKKTPMNIAKLGIEYSPVGLAKSAVYDTVQLRKGNITVNKYIDNVSKGLTGTGIALVGYALAQSGILRASGSDDKEKADYDEALGNQTYSIKIGDNTYSLDWIAPSGIPLFIGAEIWEIMQSKNEIESKSTDDEKTYKQAINSAVNILDGFTNAMNPMTEMSMLSGLTSALQSYQQGSSQMLAKMGTNAVKSYVNQFVPTALGQIAKITDDYDRSTSTTATGVLPKAIESTKNQIIAKIPGARQSLPKKTNIWGKEVKQPENIIRRALETAVLPYTRKSISTGKVDEEISRIYKNTGESSVLPDNINKYLTIDKQKYIMTSDEYSKYKKESGKISYNLLNNLISSENYKKMSDNQKQIAIEQVYKYSKEKVKMDYSKQNKLDCESSNLYKTIEELDRKKGNSSNYFEYLALTSDMHKDKEKLETLVKSNYNATTKMVIYENNLKSSGDVKYEIIKSSGLDINEYLKYRLEKSKGTFDSDKKDDGTINGKTISGSAKKKVHNYVEGMKATYMQKILLYGLDYTPSKSDKETIVNYINSIQGKSNQEKLDMLDEFSWIQINKNGTFKIK